MEMKHEIEQERELSVESDLLIYVLKNLQKIIIIIAIITTSLKHNFTHTNSF